ncbi:hypothetical protein FPV67DRAFT_1426930 [Lyophyllum atratum]|nr:hypothetical protein FPV67DRAFT_1426930 [Lyophyllum atratum]
MPGPVASLRQFVTVNTAGNEFGIFRRYIHDTKFPPRDPDALADISSLSNIRPPALLVPVTTTPTYGPYPNKNAFELGDWFWNYGAQKSQENFRRLVEIVGSEDFIPASVRNLNWGQINTQLGLNDWDTEEWEDEDAGWHESSVKIKVPFHRNTPHPGVQDFFVKGFHCRSLVSVIREKLSLKKFDIPHFHTEPYELLWQRNRMEPPIPLYGEIYTSTAFSKAHHDLQTSPPEPGCDLQRVVVALMFWSDATHLTNFGDAQLTPVYMYFGNESKYRRCKPSHNLAEHVAYFEDLPSEFKDFVSHYTDKKIKASFMTHCRRELVHAQWSLLLDDEFLQAYKHGIVIKWEDGVERRFYPRILTYSADYKEKYAQIATVRQNGTHPCPRCKVPLSEMHLFGTKKDRKARLKLERLDDLSYQRALANSQDAIHRLNFAVDSAYVERQLKPDSLVPTLNTFSTRLGPELLGATWFRMFVVDLLHEVELGVWKALFIHLLRILDSVDEQLLHELDRRFRLVPTFGRDTIRRFSRNASEMKKMAARDFEDLLQCIIPVFEGLLEEPHNSNVLELLFCFAHWHGLAKLRLHSGLTLELLDNETTALGDCLRKFESETCPSFTTRELQREAEARRRKNEANSKATADEMTQSKTQGKKAQPPSGPQPVTFNLVRYKAHALGDYTATIKEYGTTSCLLPQKGELEHRTPKGNYKRTSKKQFQRQLPQIERRQSRLRRIRQSLIAESSNRHGNSDSESGPSSQDPTVHYHIGTSENVHEHITTFLQSPPNDLATKNFVEDLKAHLLPRLKSILQIPDHQETTLSEAANFSLDAETVYFRRDLMYRHNLMRVNYTTYDARRALLRSRVNLA